MYKNGSDVDDDGFLVGEEGPGEVELSAIQYICKRYGDIKVRFVRLKILKRLGIDLRWQRSGDSEGVAIFRNAISSSPVI